MKLYGGLEKSPGQRDCTKGHTVPVCILGRNVRVVGVGVGMKWEIRCARIQLSPYVRRKEHNSEVPFGKK